MRKLLLSTMAGLVAATGLADLASAQTAPPGTKYTVVPKSQIPSPPEPGTIAVSVGGLFNWMLNVGHSTGDSSNGQKLASYFTQGFTRIFLGMDGQSSNGILYGTQFQIRQNFGTPSGGGASGTGTGGSTLYVQQGYAYVSTPTIGKLQVGAGNGPSANFSLGEFDGFNDGGWNGDIVVGTSAGSPAFPFLDDSFFETSDKIAYYSPNFAGFDFGVSWEPSQVTLNDSTACGAGGAGALSKCDNLSSSNIAADLGKRRNTFDIGVRYRGTFGPVGLAVSGGYIGSGTVNYTGGAAAQKYHGLSDGIFGTELTIAGVTFGGQIIGGSQNGGNFSLEPVGGKTAISWIAGAQYTNGPYVVGASYFNSQFTGAYSAASPTGQEADYGLAAGGYYALTPGIGFFVSYLYGQRKQSGYDLVNGGTNAVLGEANGVNNHTQAQAGGVGISLQW